MLRACHRVLKRGGILSYVVIAIADRLSPDEIATAIEAGPPRVDAGPGYPELMATAGFVDLDVSDVTADYLTTLSAWVREWDAESAALIPIVGAEEFAEQQATRRGAVAAIERGLLRRYLLTGTRP